MDASPLDKLPAELQIAIYEFVLVEPKALYIALPSNGKPRIESPNNLGITATCKDVRAVCLPIFYSLNKFCLCSDVFISASPSLAGWSEALDAWLDTIGDDNRQRLRHVQLHAGFWDMLAGRTVASVIWRSALTFVDQLVKLQLRTITYKLEVWWSHSAGNRTSLLNLNMIDLSQAEGALEAAIAEVETGKRGIEAQGGTAGPVLGAGAVADYCIRRFRELAVLVNGRCSSKAVSSDNQHEMP
ncbi:hypothetical protein LTR85_008732 [Meristemomyces frigidus]|nr:hypothetical protein LTR85_008732 [Meristemomyces frigidus]